MDGPSLVDHRLSLLHLLDWGLSVPLIGVSWRRTGPASKVAGVTLTAVAAAVGFRRSGDQYETQQQTNNLL